MLVLGLGGCDMVRVDAWIRDCGSMAAVTPLGPFEDSGGSGVRGDDLMEVSCGCDGVQLSEKREVRNMMKDIELRRKYIGWRLEFVA